MDEERRKRLAFANMLMEAEMQNMKFAEKKPKKQEYVIHKNKVYKDITDEILAEDID